VNARPTPKSLVDLAVDRAFLGDAALTGESFAPWRAFLSAVSGQPPVDDAGRDLILRCTGRATVPTRAAKETWALCGRRSGKTRIAAYLGTYLATVPRYQFSPGERGTLVIIASDRKQAKTVLRYIEGYFTSSAMLHRMVAIDGKTKKPRLNSESIDLTNGVTIEVLTANYRALRGYTVIGAIADEVAFWPPDQSANPDAEILAALRPAMATVPNAMLIAITSVYSRTGETWRMYREHYGKDLEDVLVWKATSREMNPTLPQSVIDRAMQRDAPRARAEYLSEFRSDVEGFLTREAIDAVVEPGVLERPPQEGPAYVAFCDPAGGSGADSMTLGIAHHEGGRTVLDALREVRPPFSPSAVTQEFVDTLKRYGLTRVTGDRYSGDWVPEQFRRLGVLYQPAEQSKSELYGHLLPLVNSRQAVLLDHPRLVGQLLSLERHTARGGRDSIDHPPRMHDDVANAAAGALQLAAGRGTPYCEGVTIEPAGVSGPSEARLLGTYGDRPRRRMFGGSW